MYLLNRSRRSINYIGFPFPLEWLRPTCRTLFISVASLNRLKKPWVTHWMSVLYKGGRQHFSWYFCLWQISRWGNFRRIEKSPMGGYCTSFPSFSLKSWRRPSIECRQWLSAIADWIWQVVIFLTQLWKFEVELSLQIALKRGLWFSNLEFDSSRVFLHCTKVHSISPSSWVCLVDAMCGFSYPYQGDGKSTCFSWAP